MIRSTTHHTPLVVMAAAVLAPIVAGQPFNTIINLPADTLPGAVGSNTQVNVGSGGNIYGYIFGAQDGSLSNIEINMNQGAGGAGISIGGGALLNLNGAVLDYNTGNAVRINDGGLFNLYSGRTNDGVVLAAGSITNLYGGMLGVPRNEALYSPVSLSGELNVYDGLVANDLSIQSSGVLNMYGGEIHAGRDPFEGTEYKHSLYGTINLFSGELTEFYADGRGNPTVNQTGGVMDDLQFDAFQREYNISGGLLTRSSFDVAPILNITGGRVVDNYFLGVDVYLRGGALEPTWPLENDTFLPNAVFIYGDDFVIDGVPVEGLNNEGDTVRIDMTTVTELMGTCEDGSAFYFDNRGGVYQNTLSLDLIKSAVDRTPVVEWEVGDHEIGGVHPGQTVNINEGLMPGHFIIADGGLVNINASGELGEESWLMPGGEMHVNGGTVTRLRVRPDTILRLTDGFIDDFPESYSTGGTFIMTGGEVGKARFKNTIGTVSGGYTGDLAFRDSTVEVTGGYGGVGGLGASTITVRGGTAPGVYGINDNSHIEFYGGEDIWLYLSGNATAIIKGGDFSYIDYPGCLAFRNGTDTLNRAPVLCDVPLDTTAGTTAQIYGTQFLVDGVDMTDDMTEDVHYDLQQPYDALTVVLPDGNLLEAEGWRLQGTITLIKDQVSDDLDGDGVLNEDDICEGYDDNIDSDGDGVPDGCDACPGSDDRLDIDQDGIPDDCDRLCAADVVPDGIFNQNDFQYMYIQIYFLGAPKIRFDLDQSGAFDFLDWLELLNGCGE